MSLRPRPHRHHRSSIAAAAFFAGAETALTAASRARMHALEMAGDSRAKLVTRLIGDARAPHQRDAARRSVRHHRRVGDRDQRSA